MPTHYWGDKDFDWKALSKAINQGTWIMKKIGRIGVYSKEKYGSARWSLYPFNGTMHSLTHPSYVYSQYPKWLWSFDVRYKPLKFLIPVIGFYQSLVIKFTFEYLCWKFPHIIDEIIQDSPYNVLFPKLRKRAGKMWSRWCPKCKIDYTCDNKKCPHCEGK